MKIINLFFYFPFLIILFASCEKEFNNPYDEKTKKDQWKPDSIDYYVLSATQCKLMWTQKETHIDGFKIDKYENGVWVNDYAVIPNNLSEWVDNAYVYNSATPVKYRVYAYALKNISDKLEILVNPILPAICTNSILITSTSTATSGGVITQDGKAKIFQRGVCWSTTPSPTTINSKTSDGIGTGSFASSITGLSTNTTYYVRAYAINGAGINYGNEVSFEIIADIDGNIYHIIQIGSQVWMVENLKVTKYRDGISIPFVTDNTAWANLTTGAICYYDNDATFKNTYGPLYNWYAVNTGKLAPVGWHVPTDAEWTTLINYLGGEDIAGGKLKATNYWDSPNTGATNESGFTALPGGYRDVSDFFFISIDGFWWSSSEENVSDAWFRVMYNNQSNVGRITYANSKANGLSVRCIRD